MQSLTGRAANADDAASTDDNPTSGAGVEFTSSVSTTNEDPPAPSNNGNDR